MSNPTPSHARGLAMTCGQRGVDFAAAPLRVRGVDLAAAPLRVRGVDIAAAPLHVKKR